MADKDIFGNDIPEEEKFRLKNGSFISEGSLKIAEEDTQIEVMRVWFFSNFQDPVEETPYDGREGGYQFRRGPFDAREELESRFEGIVPEEVMDILVRELENQAMEWEGVDRDEDYDDYLIESIAPPSEHIKRFHVSIESIRRLVKTKVDSTEEQFFFRLLYASVITALETYLSDRFISSITNNPKALRNFVETFPAFRKEPMKLSDIFKKSEGLERQVRKLLLGEFLWHRVIIASKMFSDTFDVHFPEPNDLRELLRSIDTRHDLVHRSGVNKDGVEHTITPEAVNNLISEAGKLVSWIDVQEDKFKATGDGDEDVASQTEL